MSYVETKAICDGLKLFIKKKKLIQYAAIIIGDYKDIIRENEHLKQE